MVYKKILQINNKLKKYTKKKNLNPNNDINNFHNIYYMRK